MPGNQIEAVWKHQFKVQFCPGEIPTIKLQYQPVDDFDEPITRVLVSQDRQLSLLSVHEDMPVIQQLDVLGFQNTPHDQFGVLTATQKIAGDVVLMQQPLLHQPLLDQVVFATCAITQVTVLWTWDLSTDHLHFRVEGAEAATRLAIGVVATVFTPETLHLMGRKLENLQPRSLEFAPANDGGIWPVSAVRLALAMGCRLVWEFFSVFFRIFSPFWAWE